MLARSKFSSIPPVLGTRCVVAGSVLKSMLLDFSATYNFTNYVGVSGGWRRTKTSLQIDSDKGDLTFSGLWLGGVVRY